uniref:Zinc finger RING-type eukaryotic domain-containing protein n=1 Tax=Fundulus heteroclitus TaxID=8078 RepID=A0A3Q2UK57_FUNHE
MDLLTQNRFQMDQEKLSCSICLDLLKEPSILGLRVLLSCPEGQSGIQIQNLAAFPQHRSLAP